MPNSTLYGFLAGGGVYWAIGIDVVYKEISPAGATAYRRPPNREFGILRSARIVSGNTIATSIMIGEKAAAMNRSRARREARRVCR